MPVHDDLGLRMKENYEKVAQTKLLRRTPVALRIDGKAFHTFTRGFLRPFDPILMNAMQATTFQLCKNIQGCVFGYTQSDKITLILLDYQTFETDAWFGYEVQKLCSIGASMATLYFNDAFNKEYLDMIAYIGDGYIPDHILSADLARKKGAMFDCRCFNIPKEEVANLLYWRQLDATRNSIQSCGQAYFSQKQLQNKTCNDIQDMLFTEKNFNWNDLTASEKRGTACYKTDKGWLLDDNTPRFNLDWNYINKHIYIGEK